MKSTIFREYDIRGIAGKDFDAMLPYKLGRAYAKLARQKLGKAEDAQITVSVGRDVRTTGEEYANALISGLNSAGVHTVNLGMVSTPITYFSIFHRNYDGGIMVTGSHNPPEYNGFKICAGKDTLHGSEIQELRRLIEADSTAAIEPTDACENAFEIIEEYKKYVVENVKVTKKLKVVVDAGNGAGCLVAPDLYRALGCEVTELFCEPDGNFPNHEADPTVEANLQDVIAKVKEVGADLGIAFDGDADRIGVVNEAGEILWGDELMVLLSRDILKTNPKATIISEVKSSYRLYDDIAKNGGEGIMWKTGHSLIKSKMKETKAALAGEMSGHIFFADRYFGFDDAVYAGARVLEILANTDAKLSALLQDLPKTVNTPEIRVDCDDDKKFDVIEKVKNAVSSRFKCNDIDGVRVEFGDAWGLVRASNTQPVIVMRFEAETQNRLNEVMEILKTEVRNAGVAV